MYELTHIGGAARAAPQATGGKVARSRLLYTRTIGSSSWRRQTRVQALQRPAEGCGRRQMGAHAATEQSGRKLFPLFANGQAHSGQGSPRARAEEGVQEDHRVAAAVVGPLELGMESARVGDSRDDVGSRAMTRPSKRKKPNSSVSTVSNGSTTSSFSPNASVPHVRSSTPPPRSSQAPEIIEIPDSPLKDSPPKLKTLAEMAVERRARVKKPVPQHLPLWPSHINIHVKSSPTMEELAISSLKLDLKGKGRALVVDDCTTAACYGGTCPSYEHLPSLNTSAPRTPSSISKTPLLLGCPSKAASSDIWPVHYAPESTDALIGSQATANGRTLRDWLEALSVEGVCAQSSQILHSNRRR